MQYHNILLIDDDVEDQEIFNSALSEISKELQCVSLTNAKVALDKLSAHELKPDVIFLDLNMPIMGGLEFLEQLKSRNGLSQIPVIIFSTSSNPSTVAKTKHLGAIDFITKPNRFDTLVEVLKPFIQ